MKVVYKGHDPVLLTNYDGTTYAFHKDIPVDISAEVYNSIIQSGHINATEVMPVEDIKIEEPVKETIVEKVKEQVREVIRKRGRPRK